MDPSVSRSQRLYASKSFASRDLIVSKSAPGGLLVCPLPDRIGEKNASDNRNIHRLPIKASLLKVSRMKIRTSRPVVPGFRYRRQWTDRSRTSDSRTCLLFKNSRPLEIVRTGLMLARAAPLMLEPGDA